MLVKKLFCIVYPDMAGMFDMKWKTPDPSLRSYSEDRVFQRNSELMADGPCDDAGHIACPLLVRMHTIGEILRQSP